MPIVAEEFSSDYFRKLHKKTKEMIFKKIKITTNVGK